MAESDNEDQAFVLAQYEEHIRTLNAAIKGLERQLNVFEVKWDQERSEWAIFHRNGELHRGPWPEEEARNWLQECDEMGIRKGTFHLRYRTVGPWTRLETETDSG